MRPLVFLGIILGILTGAIVTAHGKQKPDPAGDQNSVVITFKDGHQQSIPLSDVTRIEFKSAPIKAASGSGSVPPAHPVNSARFVGRWEAGDGTGSTFFIRLERDGTASKSIGSPRGTWALVNGEAQITWEDGWRDVIRKAGSKYEKLGFSPGHSFSDAPSNVADARNTDPSPI